MLEKCVLEITGAYLRESANMQGVEGGIHAVRLLWQKHAQEEDWGFLLIDTRNAFNE